MVPDDLNTLNYPIETDIQKKFWGSKHKCNRMKSIIAFSLNLDNANDNLRRYGYTNAWRKKALAAFGKYVNTPTMTGVNFSELQNLWWECMKAEGTPSDELKAWLDKEFWDDSKEWGY